jgi:hypothetical protein
MTTGWIVINTALALVVGTVVAGIAVLVPHRLHRQAMRHDASYAQYHARYHGAIASAAGATRADNQRRTPSRQRHPQAA